jgi:HK97 family phage major capsid protein
LHQIRAALGLNESVPSDSGFLVQTDFSSDIIMSAFKGAKVAPLCKKITISNNSNSVKINAIDETSRVSTRSGGVLGYWLPEAGTKLPSQPKFRQIDLNLKKICVVTYATDEVLQDVSVLNTLIRDAMVDEITFRIDDAVINGTGAGMPLGIIPSGAMISVTKQTGQKLNTIVAENIFDMWSRLLPGSESDAVWFINKNVVPQLYSLNLAVGTGGVSIYTPANSIAGAPYQSLMGRPVIPIEQCPTLGTKGDIILADMKNGYVLADKGGVQVDMSIHIAFLTDESCFRAVYRVDACPILSAPITPFKGSSASHFVAIETRA